MADVEKFIENSKPFITWMLNWQDAREPASLKDLTGGDPETVGIISVDVIKGFCNIGPLSSERVNTIVDPIVDLFNLAWGQGVRTIALAQDTHTEDAVEFMSYPPHCVRGTAESEAVDAYQQLPFYDQFKIVEKNALSAGLETDLNAWVDAHEKVKTWIIVGDCTDLCTYNTAMHMRLRANALNRRGVRVIVPINTVDTFDTPVSVAEEAGIPAHDADFLHSVFLYHMMTNGIEVVSEITA